MPDLDENFEIDFQIEIRNNNGQNVQEICFQKLTKLLVLLATIHITY